MRVAQPYVHRVLLLNHGHPIATQLHPSITKCERTNGYLKRKLLHTIETNHRELLVYRALIRRLPAEKVRAVALICGGIVKINVANRENSFIIVPYRQVYLPIAQERISVLHLAKHWHTRPRVEEKTVRAKRQIGLHIPRIVRHHTIPDMLRLEREAQLKGNWLRLRGKHLQTIAIALPKIKFSRGN